MYSECRAVSLCMSRKFVLPLPLLPPHHRQVHSPLTMTIRTGGKAATSAATSADDTMLAVGDGIEPCRYLHAYSCKEICLGAEDKGSSL